MRIGKCPGCGGTVDQGQPKGYCKACGLRPIDYFKAKAVGELRDQLAATAVAGLLAMSADLFCAQPSYAEAAREAYAYADAMLAERGIVRDKHGGIPAKRQKRRG